jgi:hypothetical protein
MANGRLSICVPGCPDCHSLLTGAHQQNERAYARTGLAAIRAQCRDWKEALALHRLLRAVATVTRSLTMLLLLSLVVTILAIV